jgi:hypothetical protein
MAVRDRHRSHVDFHGALMADQADDLRSQLSEAQKLDHDNLVRAFEAVIATVEGKRVLFWILEQSSIYADAFAGEYGAMTNYTLGQQSNGRKLIAKLDAINPRHYPNLLLDVAAIKEADRAEAKAVSDRHKPEDDE